MNSRTTAINCLFIALFSFMFLPLDTFADEATPVKIKFDDNSERIDFVSGKQVPAYEFAETGSVRFYLWDIHDPQEYFTFLHDGVQIAPIEEMFSIKKVQEQFAVWIISFKSGWINSPRVRELAVSFIPLEQSSSGLKTGERVYLKMSDMSEIIWE